MRCSSASCAKLRVRSVRPFVGLAIRLTAGAVWLAAGVAKIADLEQFRVQVEAYDAVPHAFAAPFAYGLPFVEVGIGLYLFVGLLVRGTAALSCLLMVLFVVAMVQARLRGLVLDCGCFGALARQPIGWWTIARDIALGVPGLVMLILPSRFLSLDARLLGRRDAWESPGQRVRSVAATGSSSTSTSIASVGAGSALIPRRWARNGAR
jgi:uncharacterized membrane protein YphA (DoxX/SURF4 family)